MKETVRVREAREPRKKDMSRTKKRKNIDSCIKVAEEISKCWSTVISWRDVEFPGRPQITDPSSIIGVSPLSKPRITTRFMYNVCIEERVSVLERLSMERVK